MVAERVCEVPNCERPAELYLRYCTPHADDHAGWLRETGEREGVA